MRLSPARHSSRKPASIIKRASVSLRLEHLEDRTVPATFSVVNLDNSGAGSLRQALLDANANPGQDFIDFDVAGTITLTGALPSVTGEVHLDGTTGTGYAGTPVVEIDYNHFAGLQFVKGSSGSSIRSLGFVNSSGAGLSVNNAASILVVGNYIGVGLDGVTPAGNAGNGLEFISSNNNVVGGTEDAERNVISGNGSNGILFNQASGNRVVNNFIGTDATGFVDVGNAANGVYITNKSLNNLIGGSETGGNDPTNDVFVRPPQGNLISGNQRNGVYVYDKSQQNTLSGNFIGTDFTGNAPLGNTLNGVVFDSANNNSLIGCLQSDDPFVYYNVISGNGGNGFVINNSNNTTVQANFFGLGADNQTPVGNQLNGVLIQGSSTKIVFGGVIPLGNVVAANTQNGIVVQDKASGFQSFNSFVGVAAFKPYTDLGNGWDGMKFTSTGGFNEVRTSVISENGDDGIDISGNAKGVLIAENIIGMNTSGETAMGNVDNGVEISGNAHDIVIGAKLPSFSIIPHNAISGNGGNGVAVLGKAKNVLINYSFIGTNIRADAPVGNTLAGVRVGPGAQEVTIGSNNPALISVISGNGTNGVELVGTTRNSVVGALIGVGKDGVTAIGNLGDGIYISNSSKNTIGREVDVVCGRIKSSGLANIIANNGGNGINVVSGTSNGIHANSIYNNTLLGIDLGLGANKNQPAPVLTSVQVLPLAVQVKGTMTGKAHSTFVLEFYANDVDSPSGQYYLGAITVKTNHNGIASFTFNAPVPPNGAQFFTATATDSQNNTSRFSGVVSSV